MEKIITDQYIKEIFDNLRNLGLCALVFGASGYYAKHSGRSNMHEYEILVAIFLFLLGVFLASINIVHGMAKLKNLPYSRAGISAFAALYGILAMEMIRAVFVLRAP